MTGKVFLAMALSVLPLSSAFPQGGVHVDDGVMMGVPVGAAEEVDYDVCPRGVETVRAFMEAWRNGDYRGMYDLIDDRNKEDYTLEDAKFDFQFMEFKQYKISSIRKSGDNFEFLVSHGDWRDGDKEVKKMIISGRTFKIIMPSRSSVFKESIERYFR